MHLGEQLLHSSMHHSHSCDHTLDIVLHTINHTSVYVDTCRRASQEVS